MTGKFQRRRYFDPFHLFVVLAAAAIIALAVVGVLAEQVNAR